MYIAPIQQLLTALFSIQHMQLVLQHMLMLQHHKLVLRIYQNSSQNILLHGKAEINLPRTAQQQYDVTQHIPLSEAQAGDLVFFHSTYNAGSYITHVGIYLGNNRMFHAGDPIGYADLTSPYWQQHLVGAGRIKQ